MRITRYFSAGELLCSRSHPELAAKPIELPPEHLVNLCRLTHEVLMPIRNRFGPVVVTSGYRNHRLNEAVNGSADSRHLTGCAVDFTTANFAPEAVWASIQEGDPKASWDRLAWYPDGGRFHADIDEHGGDPRGLLYVAESGGWRRL